MLTPRVLSLVYSVSFSVENGGSLRFHDILEDDLNSQTQNMWLLHIFNYFHNLFLQLLPFSSNFGASLISVAGMMWGKTPHYDRHRFYFPNEVRLTAVPADHFVSLKPDVLSFLVLRRSLPTGDVMIHEGHSAAAGAQKSSVSLCSSVVFSVKTFTSLLILRISSCEMLSNNVNRESSPAESSVLSFEKCVFPWFLLFLIGFWLRLEQIHLVFRDTGTVEEGEVATSSDPSSRILLSMVSSRSSGFNYFGAKGISKRDFYWSRCEDPSTPRLSSPCQISLCTTGKFARGGK